MGRMAPKTAAEHEKMSALNRALKGMFKTLQSRPVPDRLRSVVDQLDEGDEARPKKRGRG
jgi:anti-sigma factor RsiW